MVGLGAKGALLAILLAATVFAGCVGDDGVDPDTEDDGSTTGSDANEKGTDTKKSDADADKEGDAAKKGCQFTFCLEGHVYAPVWDEGMTWTYDVAGSFYPVTDYSASIGVFKINEDHFLVGSDSEDELINNVVSRYGIMTGEVQKDTYGLLEDDAYQDILGFRKIDDSKWKALLWGIEFTLAKGPTEELEHAKGSALGFVVNGESEEGGKLTIHYASDVAWLTFLEWKGPDGELKLSYTLTDYNHDGNVADMKIWNAVDWEAARGMAGNAPVGYKRWPVGGEGSFVLLHAVTDADTMGQLRATNPDGETTEFQHSGGEIESVKVGFMIGDWLLSVITDRGGFSGSNSSLYTFQVSERSASGG